MGNTARVLVIDDDEIVGKSFDRVLTPKGYDVTFASSGSEGVHDAEENDYDVVFTDLRMPGMDGFEAAERIRARAPWTPIVVITGYGDKESVDKASILGLNGFVRKPLTPEMIESITLKTIAEKTAIIEADPVNEPVFITEKAERKGVLGFVRNAALFVASPFIALGYIFALPAVGLFMIGKLGYEAYKAR